MSSAVVLGIFSSAIVTHLRELADAATRGTLAMSDAAARGTLVVHLMDASGLRAADRGGTSDPYVKLKLGGAKRQSTVVKKTLAPTWAERFEFEGEIGELAAETLKVHVKQIPEKPVQVQRRVVAGALRWGVRQALAQRRGRVRGTIKHTREVGCIIAVYHRLAIDA